MLPPSINQVWIQCPQSLAIAYKIEADYYRLDPPKNTAGTGWLILPIYPADYSRKSAGDSQSQYSATGLVVSATFLRIDITVRSRDNKRLVVEKLAMISQYNSTQKHVPLQLRDYHRPDFKDVEAGQKFTQRVGLIPPQSLADVSGTMRSGRVSPDGWKFSFLQWLSMEEVLGV